jgi:integrase
MPPKPGYKKSSNWHVRGITPKGHKYFKSTGIPVAHISRIPKAVYDFERTLIEKLDAEAMETEYGVYIPANMPVTLESLEKLYWERLTTRPTLEETKASYRKAWERLHKFFDVPEKWQSPHHLAIYSKMRQDEGASPKTVIKELNVLLGAYKLAAEGGMVLPKKPERPKNFRPHKANENEGKYIAPEDFYKFIRILRKQRNGTESADRMMLSFLTGIRWGESNRLKREDPKVPKVKCEGLVRVVEVLGKNNKWRWVPLGPMAWEVWQRSVPFKSFSNHQGVTRLCKRLGLDETYHLRDCRATFATETADALVSQASIDAVMGHTEGMSPLYQKAHARRLAKVALEAEQIFADAQAAVEEAECGHRVDDALRRDFANDESA